MPIMNFFCMDLNLQHSTFVQVYRLSYRQGHSFKHPYQNTLFHILVDEIVYHKHSASAHQT